MTYPKMNVYTWSLQYNQRHQIEAKRDEYQEPIELFNHTWEIGDRLFYPLDDFVGVI